MPSGGIRRNRAAVIDGIAINAMVLGEASYDGTWPIRAGGNASKRSVAVVA